MGPDDIELGEDVTPLAVSRRTGGTQIVLSVRVPGALLDSVERLAEQDGATLSAVVRAALEEYGMRRTCNLVAGAAPGSARIGWCATRRRGA
jgi:hypothetical protein